MTKARDLSVVPNQSLGFKNRIINGGMTIDQRNNGASVTITTAPASTYTLDRWNIFSMQASKISCQRNAGSITPPAGFSNYIGLTSLSAYSVLSGDTFALIQNIEGYNIADLNWGTANAKTITLSFWVYSSLTGTFGGSLTNTAGNRVYVFSYSVPSANTWTFISVTIPGDTTGSWDSTNGAGVGVRFGLGSGSTFSGAAGSWGTSNIVQPTGSVSVVGTNGATFYITGCQFEVGSTATSFDTRSYGTELQLCQRYYEKNFNQTTAPQQGIGVSGQSYAGGLNAFSTSNARLPRIRFAVTKRTAPTITFFRSHPAQGGTVDGLWSWYTAGGVWLSSTNTYVTDGIAQDNEFAVEMTSSGAFTTNASYLFGGTWVASAEL